MGAVQTGTKCCSSASQTGIKCVRRERWVVTDSPAGCDHKESKSGDRKKTVIAFEGLGVKINDKSRWFTQLEF